MLAVILAAFPMSSHPSWPSPVLSEVSSFSLLLWFLGRNLPTISGESPRPFLVPVLSVPTGVVTQSWGSALPLPIHTTDSFPFWNSLYSSVAKPITTARNMAPFWFCPLPSCSLPHWRDSLGVTYGASQGATPKLSLLQSPPPPQVPHSNSSLSNSSVGLLALVSLCTAVLV